MHCSLALMIALLAGGQAAQADKVDLQVEVMGTLCASHLLQCHEMIAVLADARTAKLYPEAECQRRLKGLAGIMRAMDGQFQKLIKFEKGRGDPTALGRTMETMRSAQELMIRQSDALEEHWKTGDKGKLADYLKARKGTEESLRQIGLLK